MWVNAFFIAVSGVLLVYWFRYTCLLILSARCSQNYADMIAEANELRFPEIGQKLESSNSAEVDHFDALQNALARDYQHLTSLIRHGAEFRMAGQQLEHKMLVVDFHLMRAWYALSRHMSIPRRRQALQ